MQMIVGIQNCVQVVDQLCVVVCYFCQIELYSLVVYFVDKVVEWVDMLLYKWFESVVKDDGLLLYICELLGVWFDEQL